MKCVEFEHLESRRLLAYDLVVSAITTTTPYLRSGDSFNGHIAILNKQGRPIIGNPSVRIFLTKNLTSGDADDVTIETFEFNASITNNKRFETDETASIPAGAALGRYILAATVTAPSGPSSKPPSNPTASTTTPSSSIKRPASSSPASRSKTNPAGTPSPKPRSAKSGGRK